MSRITLGTLLLALLVLVGCSRGPQAIPKLKVDAQAATARAFELHDADGDGLLSPDELATAPGLQYAAERADANGDENLDEAELTAMISAWNEKSIGLLTLRCLVTLNRRPLPDATVRLEPEAFLDGQVETAIGRTDEFGYAFLTVPKENRPIPDAPPGCQLGLYRVVISKLVDDREKIPARYNVETELGQEVAFDDPGVMNGITYRLKK